MCIDQNDSEVCYPLDWDLAPSTLPAAGIGSIGGFGVAAVRGIDYLGAPATYAAGAIDFVRDVQVWILRRWCYDLAAVAIIIAIASTPLLLSPLVVLIIRLRPL